MPTSAVELADRLGLAFHDPSLLAEALVHSSYVNEHLESSTESNERLEFLGDAVLSLVMSEALFRRHRDEQEGVLTTRRAAIVSTRGLARIARRLGLGDALVLGQGAQNSGERGRSSVLAGLFEAIVAAIYLDAGLSAARDFILSAAAPGDRGRAAGGRPEGTQEPAPGTCHRPHRPRTQLPHRQLRRSRPRATLRRGGLHRRPRPGRGRGPQPPRRRDDGRRGRPGRARLPRTSSLPP